MDELDLGPIDMSNLSPSITIHYSVESGELSLLKKKKNRLQHVCELVSKFSKEIVLPAPPPPTRRTPHNSFSKRKGDGGWASLIISHRKRNGSVS